MDKRKTVFLFLTIASLVLTGCGSNTVPVEIDTVRAAIEESVSEDALPVMMEIDASALRAYYGLDSDDVMHFAGRMPLMNVAATEILVVRAQKNKADIVLKAFEARKAELMEKWAESDEAQYALVQSCQIVQNADWLLFVIAETADGVVSAFNGCIDGQR